MKGFKDVVVEELEAVKKQFAQDQEQLMRSTTAKYHTNRVFSSPESNDPFDISVDECWVKNLTLSRSRPPAPSGISSTPFGRQLK